MTEPIDISSLYVPRMILLHEVEPQSNIYHQITLTKDQFDAIAGFIAELLEDDDGMVAVHLDTETHYHLDEHIQEHYEAPK